MTFQKKIRPNQTAPKPPQVDAETVRLAKLQMEFLDLVGIHMGSDQLRALAAAARVRLAEEGIHGE